ncbi:transporter substrate-binding domain-containing protein [Myceligenerans pegani]|uniref:Transporter substrate-binding domain-containing protein n=1 Tax=Myceligenerans pegani TaxID=2776917 RepID=A0ABR9MVQ4_9MICO|nr:transporter substrate-binding domain-containing protein [Myceligenerans sp. TRM 65318]MBE1874943.1 transporter substrate-binding domain-containing protein [Myceligenerans sp. TRM 65318]MBE3017214.1 transporter substrate-binding domain-containing protein [Myceligenerans sp. TRM 65318]
MTTRMFRLVSAPFCALALCLASGCAPSSPGPACVQDVPRDDKNRVTIGLHSDLPGWSYSPDDASWSGFDYEFARWLGDHCDFVLVPTPIASSERETALIEGRVDLVIASYSITDERKELVTFAGPYAYTQQGVMVRDGSGISTLDDLAGRTVCAARGTTSADQIVQFFPEAVLSEQEGFGKCTRALIDGTVDAVSTDQLLLYGFAAENSPLQEEAGGDLTVLDEAFGHQELYGIGLPTDAAAPAQCEALTEAIDTAVIDQWWTDAFQNSLPDVPAPEDYRPSKGYFEQCPGADDRDGA